MLNDVQEYISDKIPAIWVKKWIDIFIPSKNDYENEVLIKLINYDENKNLCRNGFKVIDFDIYIIGTKVNKNRMDARDKAEKLFNLFNEYDVDINSTNLISVESSNLIFDFIDENNNIITKFHLTIRAQEIKKNKNK